MKYIKKTVLLFIPLILLIFFLKMYVSTRNFNNTLTGILTSTGLNVEFDDLKLKGLNKIEIQNLRIKTQDKETVITIKKADIKISLLIPSRLSRIDAYDADVKVVRYDDNSINLSRILKKSEKEKTTIDRASRLGKIYIHDSRADYTDLNYEKPFNKKMGGVNGVLELTKSNGFYLNIGANDSGESFNIEINYPKKNLRIRQMLKEVFKNKVDETKPMENLSFKFGNVEITEEAAQYVPLKGFAISGGKLSGDLTVLKKISGNLKVTGSTLKYKDYDGIITDIDTDVIIKNDIVDLKANAKVKKADVTGKLNFDMKTKLLNASADFKNFDVSEINKIEQLKDNKIDVSGIVSGNANIAANIDKELFSFFGNVTSPKIRFGNLNFTNVSSFVAMDDNKILTTKNTSFNFQDKFSDFNVSAGVNTDFMYDIDNKIGSGTYNLINKGTDVDISSLSGSYNLLSNGSIGLNFYSNKIDGTVSISSDKSNVLVNARGKSYIGVKYNGETYVVNPIVNALNYNIKTGKIQSGGLNVQMKPINQYYDLLNANIKIVNNNFSVNGKVKVGDQVLNVVGTTTSDLVHNYRVVHNSFRVDKLLRKYGYKIVGLESSNINTKLEVNITGKGSDFKGDFVVSSNYGNMIAEYEKLYIKGKINDVKNLNVEAVIVMDELWLKYQRFESVRAIATIKNNNVNINVISEDNLVANMNYNIKSQNMNLTSNLRDYVVYDTTEIDHNLYVSNVDVNLSGKLNNLSGMINLSPSKASIGEKFVGDMYGDVRVSNSVLNFENFRFADNSFNGQYDLKTGLADVNLHIDEGSIPEYYNIPGLKTKVAGDLNLKGDLNSFNLVGSVTTSETYYNDFRIPSLTTDLSYINGDIDYLLRRGQLIVDKFSVIGDEGETLFNTTANLDFATLDVNYELANQSFDLATVKDLRDKGYSGVIDINFLLKGNPSEYLSSLKIASDGLNIAGFELNNLDMDLTANESGLNIGQVYVEYENNPLLLNGYVSYLPVGYNVNMMAENFNLDFLKASPAVVDAGGIINVNAQFKQDEAVGNISISNLLYKTTDKKTNLENLNASLDIDDNVLNIGRFDGSLNGGTFDISGNFEFPSLADDFSKTKRVKLGNFDLEGQFDKIGIAYIDGVDVTLSSSNLVYKQDELSGSILVSSGRITKIPEIISELGSDKPKTVVSNKTLVESLKDEIIDNIKNQFNSNINIMLSENVKLDIENISLVRNIKGNFSGGVNITYNPSGVSLLGTLGFKKGSFVLNNYLFKIDDAEIRFRNPVSSIADAKPLVIFSASTKIDRDYIFVSMNGPLGEAPITFTSDSGLSKEQVLEVLAFRSTQTDGNTNGGQISGAINTVVDNALNQLIFSRFTGTIRETFSLENFQIKTSFGNGYNKEEVGEILKSGITTVYIQDNLYKDKILWNLELKFLFNDSDAKARGNFGYNFWVDYRINNNFGVKLGVEDFGEVDKYNTYTGVDFYIRSDNIRDLMNRIQLRRKLEVLKKENVKIREE